MAELLKNIYNDALIENLANKFAQHDSSFKKQAFHKGVFDETWDNLELKARTAHIAIKIEEHLPYSYKKQIAILLKVAPSFTGLAGMIFPTFVETFGMEDYKTSINALARVTEYSSSEFAIRPFILKHPEQTMKQMLIWSKDDNYHIRRLASEGCRPLLPWSMKLPKFVDDPSPILPILENLYKDSEDYVYRSVANNLNDISKNHPELVLTICKKWINEGKTEKWVCKHALRTLLKKGNLKAMQLFGFGKTDAIQVNTFKLEKTKIDFGKSTSFFVELKNTGKTNMYRFEYSIEYLKKNGKHNEKVFQIKEKEIQPNEEVKLIKKLDFRDLSTRKHYKGIHYINLKINGVKTERISFEIV